MYVGSSFVFSSGDERCGRSCLACTLHAYFNAFVRCARDIRFRLVWLDVVKRVVVLGFGPQWFEVARFLCGAYARVTPQTFGPNAKITCTLCLSAKRR